MIIARPIQYTSTPAPYRELFDATYGRTLLVDRPGGGEPIWINERQTDLYGYSTPD